MRRAFSIFLIVLFGLGPLSAALEASDDANLPACCRRHGAHHCAMNRDLAAMMTASDSTPSFSAPRTCSLFPGFTTGPLRPAHALAATGTSLPALLEQKRAVAILAANAPTQPIRTHAGRGPPSSKSI